MILTEQRVEYLIALADKYARAINLCSYEYIQALINPHTLGNSDAGRVVEILIKYHHEWLKNTDKLNHT